MWYLSIVTLIWAFSFSLIGEYLAGQVDPWFAGFSRVAIAFVLFLPCLKFAAVPYKLILSLMLVGGCQIGLMYGFYYHSFVFLSVPEVLLFTIVTPIYITLLNDILSKRLRLQYLLIAILAVIGAGVIRYHSVSDNFWLGFWVVQGANFCFAIGQVLYKRIELPLGFSNRHAFSWFFAGAFGVTGAAVLLFTDLEGLPKTTFQWGIIVYLGVVASALGYFLWNSGVRQVSIASTAVMNNVLIPAGLVVNLLIWQKAVDWPTLLVGGGLMFIALWLANRYRADEL